jgi:outer membrane protein assembly factor BamB
VKKIHVFTRRAPDSWVQTAVIEDPARASRGTFGSALALHGDWLFVADPGAKWRGQWGGVVHAYRRDGDNWLPMAPIVPPPGSSGFGTAMTLCHGWLLVSQSKMSGSDIPSRVLLYRVGELANRPPVFTTPPPTQVVNGKSVEVRIAATDSDGDGGLEFGPSDLPPGLSLEDLGNGQARIVGIPTDPPGTERWIRIVVKDPAGAEAVQTAVVETLSGNDLPVPGGLPAAVEIKSGEDLRLAAEVAGPGPFTWQWQRNGIDIPGANGPVLLMISADGEMTGSYTVRVGNVVGSVNSAPVAVSVRPASRMAGEWSTFGGNSEHHGHQAATLGRHRFQRVWESSPALARALNQPAVAGGLVFVTPNPNGSNFNSQVQAYNLVTGQQRWSHPLGQLSWSTPPSWHGGRLYVQIKPASAGARLWCLDSGSGAVVWQSNSSQFARFEAPAVDEGGVYTPADGFNLGMQGYNLSGQSVFSINRPRLSDWTPVLSEGRLFSWVGGEFVEHDRGNGTALWTLKPAWNPHNTLMNTVAVIRGRHAYLGGNAGLSCIDLTRPRVLWSLPSSFQGSPAVAAGRVFVLDGTDVRAVSAADGSELEIYQTGAAVSKPLIGQPLLLNDHLVTCNVDGTFVFRIGTAELVHTIPHGGYPAYSGGYLLLAGSDGVLRAYFANAAPEFSESMPVVVQTAAAAEDLILPLAPFAEDPDPDDPLTWSIRNISRPEVFRTLEIHPQSGDLTVIYNPWESGSSDVVVSITDPAGNVTEHTITFTVPQHPEPRLELAAKLLLNRQSGLYEHAITITNSGAREVAGFDLRITGLPDGVTVNNASGRDGEDWIIHHRQPLAAGASVNLLIEYYTPVRGTVLDPQVGVELITVPETHAAAPDGGLAVERCVVMDDGSVMIEFSTTPGALHEIHYSDDTKAWKLSPVRVRAAGNRVQWIDSGPPRTETPPAREKSRFYRVRVVPES